MEAQDLPIEMMLANPPLEAESVVQLFGFEAASKIGLLSFDKRGGDRSCGEKF